LFGTGSRMNPRRRILLALWLLVQLLAGQQLALAHMIGHVGESLHHHSAQTHAAADDGDEERGAGHSLSHVCTTCVSCLGFDAIAAADFRLPLPFVVRDVGVASAVPPAPTFKQSLAFLSRAPPLLLN
jgi:hypothetical protein